MAGCLWSMYSQSLNTVCLDVRFLNLKIQDGEAHNIFCPAYDCFQLVPVEVIESVVSREMDKRYLQFDIKVQLQFTKHQKPFQSCPFIFLMIDCLTLALNQNADSILLLVEFMPVFVWGKKAFVYTHAQKSNVWMLGKYHVDLIWMIYRLKLVLDIRSCTSSKTKTKYQHISFFVTRLLWIIILPFAGAP